MRTRPVGVIGLALVVLGCGPPKPKPFELLSLDGKQSYTSDSYTGKVLMLDYWATWCGPCKQVQPAIRVMADIYAKRGLVVLGVSGEAPKTVADYVKHSPLGYPAVLDRGDRVSTEFAVRGLPTVIIFDRDGSVVYQAAPPDLDKVSAILQRLMPSES
ncbi:MAG: TlpA family protein disulfide reductase [Fimbriimonadaceae bacterium]